MSRYGFAFLVALLLATPTVADEARFRFGGDTFSAGQSTTVGDAAGRDAFVAGYDVRLGAKVGEDAHMAGFNVIADRPVGGDLYAAGFSVSVEQPVRGDVTALGNSVTVRSDAAIGGNARLAGAKVTLDAPVTRAALISAETLELDANIVGDFEFFGNKIVFGPKAVIGGTVTIHAPAAIEVPANVASADRIHFEVLQPADYAGQAGKTAEHVVNGVWPAIWAVGLWWLSLVTVGALFITLLPRATMALERRSTRSPLRSLGWGILAFAAVLGLIPAAALTVVGLVLVPVLAVFAFLASIFAYLCGAYLVTAALSRSIWPIDNMAKRIGVLILAVVLAGLIGMLPFLGWLISLALLVVGFGAIVQVIGYRRGNSEKPVASVVATPEAI